MKVVACIIPVRKKPISLKTLLSKRSKVKNRDKSIQAKWREAVKAEPLNRYWGKF